MVNARPTKYNLFTIREELYSINRQWAEIIYKRLYIYISTMGQIVLVKTLRSFKRKSGSPNKIIPFLI